MSQSAVAYAHMVHGKWSSHPCISFKTPIFNRRCPKSQRNPKNQKIYDHQTQNTEPMIAHFSHAYHNLNRENERLGPFISVVFFPSKLFRVIETKGIGPFCLVIVSTMRIFIVSSVNSFDFFQQKNAEFGKIILILLHREKRANRF